MKEFKLIYTDDYALAISDDRIGYNDYCVYRTGEIIRYVVELNTDNLSKIIAHRPLTEHASQLENVPLLPAHEDVMYKLTEEEFNGFLDGFTDDAPISYIRSEFRKYVENRKSRLKPSVFRADTRDEAFRTTDDVNRLNAFYYVPKMKVDSNGILCGSYQ